MRDQKIKRDKYIIKKIKKKNIWKKKKKKKQERTKA